MLHLLAQTTQPSAWSPEAVTHIIELLLPLVFAVLAYLKSHAASEKASGAQVTAGNAAVQSMANANTIVQVAKDQVPAALVVAAMNGTAAAQAATPSNVRPPLTGTGDIQPPLPGARVDAGAGIFTQK